MFFPDHLKLIFTVPGPKFPGRYDPLRVDNDLLIATRNRLPELIELIRSAGQGTGDVSRAGRDQAQVERARAEIELADAARLAFKLPESPECLDAEALEILYQFLGWMEGKGETAGTPPGSSGGFLVASPSGPMTNT